MIPFKTNVSCSINSLFLTDNQFVANDELTKIKLETTVFFINLIILIVPSIKVSHFYTILLYSVI